VKFGIAGEHTARFEIQITDILTRHVPGSHFDDRNYAIDKKLRYLDIFNFIFTEKLGLKSKEFSKVVIVEDIFELKINRDIILSVLLQDMMVSEVTMQPDLFMPILVSQNLSGVVIDIGYKESKAIAIYQGRPIMYTLKGMSTFLDTFYQSSP
jgi:actin-related protein